MENIKRKQTLPTLPNPNAVAQLSKPNYSGISKLSRKFQEYICLNPCQRQLLVRQSNKCLELKIGLNKL